MANKDPRFNFYPDNWSGGTKRMNFLQKGAYLELLLLNFYCFSDGLQGFTEEEALKALASAPAYAELWNFLKPKFETDGAFFWSERLKKEFFKAKKNSDEQSKRALQRWNKDEQTPAYDSASNPASHTALPVNDCGNGSESGTDEKGVQGEKFSDIWFKLIFDDENYARIKSSFPKHDIDNEFRVFQTKVRGSPKRYGSYNDESIRQAFIYQLNNSTSHVTRNSTQTTTQPTVAVIEPGKSFGVEKGFSRSGTNGGRN